MILRSELRKMRIQREDILEKGEKQERNDSLFIGKLSTIHTVLAVPFPEGSCKCIPMEPAIWYYQVGLWVAIPGFGL